MGGAPYIGPRLRDGPIFEVSVSHLDTKECPDKYYYPCYHHNLNSKQWLLLISALFKHGYQSRGRVAAILHCVSLTVL